MQWPEKPTCHAVSPVFTYPDHQVWRPAETEQRDRSYPYIISVRTCGYCGSMHPEDLYLNLLNGPATLGGSDWKYGWPHKFYVKGVPNPLAGQRAVCGSTSCGDREKLEKDADSRDCGPIVEVREDTLSYEDGVLVKTQTGRPHYRRDIYGTASPDIPAKWYNEHLLDDGFDEEARNALIQQLEKHAHIRFEIVNGELKYAAPCRGYQKS